MTTPRSPRQNIPDETRRLELAREVWRATAPSEDEIESSVRRLSRRIAKRPARDPARRVVSFGTAILVFGAALAYAASGGVSLPFVDKGPAEPAKPSTQPGESPPPEPPPKQHRPGTARDGKATPGEAKTPSAAAPAAAPSVRRPPRLEPPPSSAPSSPVSPAPGSETSGIEQKSSAAAPDATWADVSRALAARDDKHAKQALESLGKSDDATTRAKARLGLAQLAASRGDCKKAYAVAIEVAASSEADARTAARARALAARCAR